MRILIVNTSEKKGGAAIAARRLMHALQKQGVNADMLVRDKITTDAHVHALSGKWQKKWHFLWERFTIWKHNGFSRKGLFEVDIANAGTDITAHPLFREADIVHLHWVNQGMLSMANIRAIAATGKPIVWTMHDMWQSTGICHHSVDCEAYKVVCKCCPQLQRPSENDLSACVFRKKKEVYETGNFSFVACSKWLETLAAQSVLTGTKPVCSIPNPLDTTLFSPQDKAIARKHLNLPTDKKLLLFSAAKTTDKRKGIDYLIEACRCIVEKYPTSVEEWGIVLVGEGTAEFQQCFPFPFYSLSYVHSEAELATIYRAVDVYVTPSLQENLPNTIAEATACGLPCVGFKVGGIPEMIDHKENGYVATYKSAEDLAEGVLWVLTEAPYERLARSARDKAIRKYAEETVARQYIQLYESLLHV
ncbi:MAG: glycosyltransferase family 4 protein [Phocaeicola sp.]|nr:glycosyltransferase family 4 protein [Phocaeicola sp.]